MQLDQVKLEFEAGRLREALIEPAPDRNGWMVLFREDRGQIVRLTDHRGAERVFHSLDHATELARGIGFETVSVEERF